MVRPPRLRPSPDTSLQALAEVCGCVSAQGGLVVSASIHLAARVGEGGSRWWAGTWGGDIQHPPQVVSGLHPAPRPAVSWHLGSPPGNQHRLEAWRLFLLSEGDEIPASLKAVSLPPNTNRRHPGAPSCAESLRTQV